MNDAWLKNMERRAEIRPADKALLCVLLVASLIPLLLAVFQGSLFALALGVLSLCLFVRFSMLMVAERARSREQVADIRARYESLSPQDREYLDEHFLTLDRAFTDFRKGRLRRLFNWAELRPNGDGGNDE